MTSAVLAAPAVLARLRDGSGNHIMQANVSLIISGRFSGRAE